MLKRLRWRTAGLILAALVLAGGGAGVAAAVTAQAPGSSGVVIACVNNVTGSVRIVPSASECRPSEHAVELAASQAPRTVSVDCTAGGSISEVLADEPVLPPLTIEITGTCTEAVHIGRDNVTLRATAPGAGIEAPAMSDTALSVTGTHIALDGLTITGGERGLFATGATSIDAENLHVTGAAFGVFLQDSATARINNATINSFSHGGIQLENGATANVSNTQVTGPGADTGCDAILIFGGGSAVLTNVHAMDCRVGVQGNGIIRIQQSVIENNLIGVIAGYGGAVLVDDNTVVRSNNQGAEAQGGAVDLGNALVSSNTGQGVLSVGGTLAIREGTVIENNGGPGVDIIANGSARIFGATIRGNGGDGIYVGDSSVAFFAEVTSTIENNTGYGIFCQPDPAVAMFVGNPGTVSGNNQGNISCARQPG